LSDTPLRILVVDDSALYRQSITNVLRGVSDAHVVGSAGNGLEALAKIAELDPDLLTLDVQMPDMNGIEVLREMNRRRMRTKAIMVSGLTHQGAQVTTDALMEGAFDFILKPSSGDSNANRQALCDALSERILAFRQSRDRSGYSRSPQLANRSVAPEAVVDHAPVPRSACRAVILGTSTGGPLALKTVLPRLPAVLSVPVLVVQHMPATYTASLASRLNAASELEVVEAVDQMAASAGRVILAPGGRHLKLVDSAAGLRVRLSDDPPENSVRPAADYLLRSAADALGGDVLAVIMTGMGRDGLEGCRRLRQEGGYVFAQGQEDCVVFGMPKAVIDAGLADRVLPLGKIAPAIVRHVKRSGKSFSY
jgi:two-component system chemotaxis response regulator CheB